MPGFPLVDQATVRVLSPSAGLALVQMAFLVKAEGDFSCQTMLGGDFGKKKGAESHTSWFTCRLDSSLSRQHQQLSSLPTVRSKEASEYEWPLMNDDGKDKHRLALSPLIFRPFVLVRFHLCCGFDCVAGKQCVSFTPTLILLQS